MMKNGGRAVALHENLVFFLFTLLGAIIGSIILWWRISSFKSDLEYMQAT
jgi:hypothetical protein